MPNKNNESEDVTPIKLVDCGLEDLVGALLHRHPVLKPTGGVPFVLEDDNARRLFAYYERNRHLWPSAKQVRAPEIDGVLNALDETPPTAKATGLAEAEAKKFWRLRRVEAHRFGGLHRHCGRSAEDPEAFLLNLERDVTLISGFNGAGKTALQNVIIWCLTGRALRSQHLPEEIHEPMDLYWTGGDAEAERTSQPGLALPPIVPIPSGAELESLGDRPRIDTWAKLTFCDEEMGEVCTVQRALRVSPRGKISMTVTGLKELGLADLALDVGTLMPGIASHMRFDEKTTFAAAIAQLTGLKPLEELGHRSKRVVTRLRTEERKKTELEAAAKLDDFKIRRQSITAAWAAQTDLGDPPYLVSPDEEEKQDQCKSSIVTIRRHLEQTKQSLESTAKAILGRSIQLETGADSDSLLQQLTNASNLLNKAALQGLHSMSIVRNLTAISNEEIESARSLIADMLTRAKAVAARLRNKQEAARWRLYSRVAAWHREQHGDAELENCPVCGTDLEDVPPDAHLDRKVSEALRQCREADADATKSSGEWEPDAARELLEKLPDSLRNFADKPPPSELLQIYRSAHIDELLADPNFRGQLQPLRKNATSVWEIATANHQLPKERDLGPTLWPEEFEKGRLASRSANVELVISLSRNLHANMNTIGAVLKRYVGELETQDDDDTESVVTESKANFWPLRNQIRALRGCVTQTKPIVSFLGQLDDLEKTRQSHGALTCRLIQIGRAATGMEAFAELEDLVFQQVSGLISVLHEGTNKWMNKIYAPHYIGGPSYSGFDAGYDKGIGLQAGIGGIQVAAHKIMNASQLRACVWAFMFSLWERVRSRIGGIDCLLLDDPQNHFDPINIENLAAAIPEMPEHGMRPLITSNDYRFLNAIKDKLPRTSMSTPSWQAQVLNPISSSRLTAGISPAIEEVFERQRVWRKDDNNEDKARQFVSSVRVYVENRLWDLLATDLAILHKPTLSELTNALRTARRNGERPFEEPPFNALLCHEAMRDTAPFYRCINKAHHHPQEITPYHAHKVDEDFGHIERLLRSCSASYARFMGRLTREDKDLIFFDLPPSPQPTAIAWEPLQLLGEVSARSSADTLADGQIEGTFEFSELGQISFFGVRSPGLSPLVLQGQVVIASLDKQAHDGDPVVALCEGKTYLRRLLGDRDDPSRIVLACDRIGTENVPPTLLLPKARTRLLPVVGVLYDQESFVGVEEVIQVKGSKLLKRNLVAARVRDDSAFPVIRSGDFVLMEAIDSLNASEIERLEDRMVVAIVGEGSERFAYLKRLGGLAAPGVHILENIGVKGHALSAATSQDAVSSGTPPLQMLWRVHGTLRILQ